MNAEVQRAFWAHYRNAQLHLSYLRIILPNLGEDLRSMSRALNDEPSLLSGQLPYIRNQLTELAEYAGEIDRAVRQKCQDGEDADRRIDVMIGVAS